MQVKIKNKNIEFESFSSGICTILSQDEFDEDKFIVIYDKLAFSNKTLGYGRYFSASVEQVKIDRVIRIPNVKGINNHDRVKIDKNSYIIELIQVLEDTNPKTLQLTLRELEMFQ